jgi:thiamine monophosphate kinase
VKKDSFESLKTIIPTLRKIGKVERGSGEVTARIGNKVRRVEPGGYQHFS